MSLVTAQGATLSPISRSEITFACVVDTETEVSEFLNYPAVCSELGILAAVFTARVVKMQVICIPEDPLTVKSSYV